MKEYKYGCQNTAKEFLDHMYELPLNPQFNPIHFQGLSKEEYVNGYHELWLVINKAYQEMIMNPQEFGIPMIVDIQYSSFNAKAQASLNSPKGLMMLLRALAVEGDFSNKCLIVSHYKFKNHLKLIKPKEKVINLSKMMNALINLGFQISDYDSKETFIVEYLDNPNLIIALKSLHNIDYKNNDYRLFSLNYDLFAKPDTLSLPNYIYAFSNYLNENDKLFFEKFYNLMIKNSFYFINSSSYKYCIEFFNNDKESYLVRCFSNNKKLTILLRTQNIDNYIHYLQTLPKKIKYPYQHGTPCSDCIYKLQHKGGKQWEIDGIKYNICLYNSQVVIKEYDINDIDYYVKILLLEAKKENI